MFRLPSLLLSRGNGYRSLIVLGNDNLLGLFLGSLICLGLFARVDYVSAGYIWLK